MLGGVLAIQSLTARMRDRGRRVVWGAAFGFATWY